MNIAIIQRVVTGVMFVGATQGVFAGTEEHFTDEDFNRHLTVIKDKVRSEDFTVIVQKPFVVVGDGDPRLIRNTWAAGTISWTVRQLKAAYFSNDPNRIIDIWLFKDKTSYEKHTQAFWHEKPGTPFGYYSSPNKALIMNIATGGGTLVHEIVHAFMEANFSNCPPWFNEGLASLYEQCEERNGTIWGLTNWRLPGLQDTIRSGHLPSFKALTAMNSNEFYSGNDRDHYSDNYAQSRYLLFYLQEKGILRQYYKAFTAHDSSDPTGYGTLQQALGEKDMSDFQRRWETYVLKLVFTEK